MPYLLKIESGPRQGEQIPVEAGVPVRVGRTGPAQVVLPEDTFLSSVHFQVEVLEGGCLLRDLNSSNGTALRGHRIREQFLHADDVFTAGQTQFRLVHAAAAGAPAEQVPATPGAPVPEPLTAASRARLLDEFRAWPQPVYAVLDAARDPHVLVLIQEHRCQHAWLFEEGTPPELMLFAPYLVPLPAESPALPALVDAGWAGHWGIYLRSQAGPWELLAFLRRLLLVTQPDGQDALFRFYDPRVLHPFLTSLERWQWPYLFGAVQAFMLPAQAPQAASVFSIGTAGLEQVDLLLDGAGKAVRRPLQGPGDQPTVRGNRLELTARQLAALAAG